LKLLRRFRLLLLLIVLLGIAYTLNRLTVDWHYVLPVEVGKVAYTATFDDFIGDWELYEGRLNSQVENSTLKLEADDINKKPFSVASQHWGDFDLSVQASPADGPLNNGYGVIFRLQTKGNSSPDDDDFYLFLVSSDGFYQVMRSIDGQQKELSNWIPSPLVTQGIDVVNHLRVVATGDRFRFYINGQPVQLCVPNNPDGTSTYNDRLGGCIDGQMLDTLVDASIGSGQLGVVIQTLDEPGVVVNFDNVVVAGPQAMDV
jgi:hypothetical protein